MRSRGVSPRQITVVDNTALQSDAKITANISGSGDLKTTGTGAITLGGNNTGLTGSVFVQGIGGLNQNNQASVYAAQGALGSGIVMPSVVTTLAGEGGPLTIGNRVITQGFNLAAGNDVTITGTVDLLSATINVQGSNVLTLAGGVGEINPGAGLTKSGPGTLSNTGMSPISGALTISAGAVVLKGNGALPNITSVTIAREHR